MNSFSKLVLASTLLAPAFANAEYQTTLGYFYTDQNEKNGFSAETTSHILGVGHFLEPVSAPGKPMDLEGFYDPTSVVTVLLTNFKFEDNVTLDSQLFEVAGAFYHDSGTLFDVSVLTSSGDLGGTVSGNQDTDGFGVGIARYLSADTRISYSYLDLTTDVSQSIPVSNTASVSTTSHEIGLQHIQELSNNTFIEYEIGLEMQKHSGASSPTDKNNITSLSATYYPTLETGFEFSFRTGSGDDEDLNRQRIEVLLTHFVNPNLSVLAGVAQTKAESIFSADESEIGFGVAYRY